MWTVGAFASGPLHLGQIMHHNGPRRPVLPPILVGLALAGVFVVGGLMVRQVPALDEQVRNVLVHADQGVTLVLVLITALNGVAEELFFRGAAYAATTRYPVPVTTVAYTAVTLATGNVMLGFAAAARCRRRSGAPRLRRDPRADPHARDLVAGDAVRAACVF